MEGGEPVVPCIGIRWYFWWYFFCLFNFSFFFLVDVILRDVTLADENPRFVDDGKKYINFDKCMWYVECCFEIYFHLISSLPGTWTTLKLSSLLGSFVTTSILVTRPLPIDSFASSSPIHRPPSPMKNFTICRWKSNREQRRNSNSSGRWSMYHENRILWQWKFYLTKGHSVEGDEKRVEALPHCDRSHAARASPRRCPPPLRCSTSRMASSISWLSKNVTVSFRVWGKISLWLILFLFVLFYIDIGTRIYPFFIL